jgi:hypothetical protein
MGKLNLHPGVTLLDIDSTHWNSDLGSTEHSPADLPSVPMA